MITQFSEKHLKVLSFLYKLSNSKDTEKKILEYKADLTEGIENFKNDLSKYYSDEESSDSKVISQLFNTAQTFRANKKLIKDLVRTIIVNTSSLFFIFTPFIFNFLYQPFKFTTGTYLIVSLASFTLGILSLYLLGQILSFIKTFEIKIGKILFKSINFLVIVLIVSSYLIIQEIEIGLSKSIIYTIYIMVGILILLVVLITFAELLIDAYYFSKKIQITDALIIESCYQLTITNWNEAIKKRSKRQNALIEIERLSYLIENDWSSHIIPGDEKTNDWKTVTLKGIAAGIRHLKREVIVPSENGAMVLSEKFTSIFQKILKHDIKGLLGAEVPALRVKKISKLKVLQSVLTAILPFSLLLALKYYPIIDLPQNYLHIGMVISGAWLLVSLLFWLDPNLAEKVTTLKSLQSVMKNQSDE